MRTETGMPDSEYIFADMGKKDTPRRLHKNC